MVFNHLVSTLRGVFLAAVACAAQDCVLLSSTPSISTLAGVNATITLQGKWTCANELYVGSQKVSWSLISVTTLKVVIPDAFEPSTIAIKSPNCSGLISFQYYDSSNINVRASTTSLRSSGGSSVTLYFDSLQLQNWTSVSLMLTKTSGECVGSHITLWGTYLGNSSVFFRGNNLLNFTLCGVGTASAQYSLNGVQHEGQLTMNIVAPTVSYRALFVYYGPTSDLGWTYALNLGRLAVSATFGVSVDTPYVESIPENDVEALKAVVSSNLPLDLVILASAGYADPMQALARLYSDIQFVLVGSDALASPPTTSNVNVLWATLHEARYLAGVVGGGMVPANGSICYIKAFEYPEVISGVDAFTLGVRKSNPHAKVITKTIGSWGNSNLEQEAAKFFYFDEDCELQAQHTDSYLPQEVFTIGGRYAIGSNADSRVFIGERVLTSPVFDWANVMPEVIQRGIDGTLGAQSIVFRLAQGAVGVAPVSAYVPTEVRDTLATELAALVARGGDEYVFCGPLHDNQGVLRIAEGDCATNEELGSLSWAVDGIVDMGAFQFELDSEEIYLSKSQRRWSLGLGLSGLGVAVLYWTLLYAWRKSAIIQFSQRRFLYVLLLGSMCGLSSDIALAFDPSYLTCRLQVWTLHLGFCVTISALFVKAWRVSVIAAQPAMKRVEVSDALLFKIIAVATGCCATYLLAWTCADGPAPQLLYCSTHYSSTSTSIRSCKLACVYGSSGAWALTIISVEVCVLFYGTSLAFRIWHVHDVFSESRWLVLAIYNIFSQILYLLVLRAFIPPASSTFIVAQVVTTFVAYVVLMNVILLPKFVELMSGNSVSINQFYVSERTIDASSKIRTHISMNIDGQETKTQDMGSTLPASGPNRQNSNQDILSASPA